VTGGPPAWGALDTGQELGPGEETDRDHQASHDEWLRGSGWLPYWHGMNPFIPALMKQLLNLGQQRLTVCYGRFRPSAVCTVHRCRHSPDRPICLCAREFEVSIR